MRRKEKEIRETSDIERILSESEVCCLSMSDMDGSPYGLPLFYGYADGHLYLHSAKTGLKVDILKNNPRVCFMVWNRLIIKPDDIACRWGASYESVIGFGQARIIEKNDEKRNGLQILMRHYSENNFDFSEKELDAVLIIDVTVESVTGKRSG